MDRSERGSKMSTSASSIWSNAWRVVRNDSGSSWSSRSSTALAVGGITVVSLLATLVWLFWGPLFLPTSSKKVRWNDGDEDNGEDSRTHGTDETPSHTNVRSVGAMGKSSDDSSTGSKLTALHREIEEIDRRAKALFKEKKYSEASVTYTEALNLIAERQSASAGLGSDGLNRQVITLTNNRSAMYEKDGQPELALVDCDAILEMDMTHVKARTRKLRLLESEGRYAEALVQVCALQLRFVHDNRDKIRLGLPLADPPVQQSKVEDLVNKIVPDQISAILQQRQAADKAGTQLTSQQFPATHTINQLLKSFSSYPIWRAQALQDGTVEKLTSRLEAADTSDEPQALANRATILLQRGRRYAFDCDFVNAVADFDAAYQLLGSGDNSAAIELLSEGVYARILEWVGMGLHMRYDLDAALKVYEAACILEPTNTELLVKKAGLEMDRLNHDEALKILEAALGLDSDSVDALFYRANLYMIRQRVEDAKTDLRKCTKLQPQHLHAHLRLATILTASNDFSSAAAELDEAEKINPRSSEVHSHRGEVNFATQDLEGAKRDFYRAIELEPLNPTPYVNAALSVMNTPPPGAPPDIAEAVRLLEKAIEVDPQFQTAYVHLGQLKLSCATDLVAARKVVELYDQGLKYCRTTEEIKEIVSMKALTVAQVEAASMLKMETLNMH